VPVVAQALAQGIPASTARPVSFVCSSMPNPDKEATYDMAVWLLAYQCRPKLSGDMVAAIVAVVVVVQGLISSRLLFVQQPLLLMLPSSAVRRVWARLKCKAVTYSRRKSRRCP
jgi:hypothetical protein